MKVCHTLIYFIFLMLEDGNSCFISDEIPIYTQEEGRSITVECSVFILEGRKLFCKDRCEDGTILVETTDDTAHRGRYSIEFKKQSASTYAAPSVSITQLKKSDSGRYRCLVTPSSVSVPYDDFEIVVNEASATSPPTSTPGPSATTFVPSSPPAATTPTLSSTSSSSSSEIPELLAVSQPGTLLVVGVRTAVVVVVLLLSVVLLLVYKRKTGGSVCLKKRRSSDRNSTKVAVYENCSPVSTCEDSTYQSLNPASRDQDQTYSTLTETQQK
ncbi:uncharacterized protein LOC125019150 isoform X2 [Mugil cephalus]|uniref:uncharacterized protein LOC125019150 isoform X2 n=1 Tax=Mugil cephalus TaxID=48193 RepID=UPI001FB80885|nr:uncharacterized protein LOC125019150 isoform X2 [Mugil cephalus]